MSADIKYAYKRHNTWVYRRTYPKALQPILGSSLKQSLRTADAKQAKARVAELNQTFTNIVKEAQAHADAATDEPNPETAKLAVARPRYQRARFLGEQPVHGLARRYLKELSLTLRPGTTKSIRYALELLSSYVGKKLKIGELPLIQEEISQSLYPSSPPNVRKYAEAKEASLTKLVELSQTYESISLTPQTQGRIFKQMQRFLDWCVREGELDSNPWSTLSIRAKPEVSPHGVLTDAQVSILLKAKDRVLHSALLFGLLQACAQGDLRTTGRGYHSQGEPGAVYPNQGQTLFGSSSQKQRNGKCHFIKS